MPFLTSPELESKWSSMARDELLGELRKTRDQLDGERRRSEHLAVSLRQVEEKFIIVQKQVETEEEYITNTMMKRLEQLKKEKAKIATEVEQEEELITNTLQKKLEKLTKEKVDLENRLEAEQEYIVNKLRKQLEQLSVEKNKLFREKIDLENQLEAEQEYILNRLQKQVDKLASEKKHLQKEKSDLQRTVTDLGASTEKLKHEKVLLEQQMEMEEENIVNRLQRQLESVLSSFRMLEQKLETKGLNLKELGINTGDLGAELTHAYSRSPSLSGSYDKLGSGHLLLDMHAPGSSPSASPSIMGGFLSGSRRERPLSSQSSSLHELLAK